jgi:DNA-binding LacI/PurR family transcriptional regulator
VSTIRDIARMAGVSVSTASLALNGDPRVRPQTRSRVEEAAATLDYHPLRAARSLSSGRTWSLHLLNPGLDLSMSSGFFTRFVRGIHDAARDRGYGVALSVPSDEDEARSILRRLVSERWADGVVLMNPSEHDDVLEDVVRTGFPHVLLGRSPVAGVSSVDNDNERAAFDAATHLLSRGRRDLLLVNGPARHTFTQDRARGFLRALTASGADADAGRVLFGDGSADAARRQLGERLDRGQAVDGLVAARASPPTWCRTPTGTASGTSRSRCSATPAWSTWSTRRLALLAGVRTALPPLHARRPGGRARRLPGRAARRASRRSRRAGARRALRIGPWYVLADEFLVSPESLVRNLMRGAGAPARPSAGRCPSRTRPTRSATWRSCRCWSTASASRRSCSSAASATRASGSAPSSAGGRRRRHRGVRRPPDRHLLRRHRARPPRLGVPRRLRPRARVRQMRAALFGPAPARPPSRPGSATRSSASPAASPATPGSGHVLLLNGSDHLFPQANLPEVLDQLGAAIEGVRFVHADVEEFVDAPRPPLDHLERTRASSAAAATTTSSAASGRPHAAQAGQPRAPRRCSSATPSRCCRRAALHGHDDRPLLDHAWRTPAAQPPARLDLRLLDRRRPPRDAHPLRGR